MKKYRTGLVVGKFCPLHYGHIKVILTAYEQCDRVIVISYSYNGEDDPSFPRCEPSEREYWLKYMFQDRIEFVVIPASHEFRTAAGTKLHVPRNDEHEEEHRLFCLDVADHHFGAPTVDAVFTSEKYGDGFAAFLQAEYRRMYPGLNGSKHTVDHVCVDRQRKDVPISGTALRADRTKLKGHVPDHVRGSFIPRIAVLGGESSGKTTLTEALAAKMQALYVEEYGRRYTDIVGGVHNLRLADMLTIGRRQLGLERSTAMASASLDKDVIICDTTLWTTIWYSYELFGTAEQQLLDLANQRQYDLYVVCDPSIPFVQDGTRQDDDFRQRAHKWHLDAIKFDKRRKYVIVKGTVEERVQQVLAAWEKVKK